MYKKILIGLFITTGLTVLGIGVHFYHSFSTAIDTMHQPVKEVSSKREEIISVKKQEPFSVLLLGVDEREDDMGRSDAIIILTVNPELESIQLLSIPRDTRTEIIGNHTTEKMNHAYARGGIEMAITTVEDFLDLPIDYYIQMNMDGFTEMIDVIGGIKVDNDMNLTYEGEYFPKGELQLTGEEALVFSRIRYEDPRGDFGRQLRQRQVIQAILHEGANLSSILKYDAIFETLSAHIKTNLTFKDMIDIQKNYKGVEKNIEQLQFEKGEGDYIDGIWYYLPDEEELHEIQLLLKAHLLL